MKKIPLHIDVDTGTDDAIALICAMLSENKVDITSISTVAGNVPLEYTSKNTLNITDMLNRNIPVAKGASKPLLRDLEAAISHGASGFGDVDIPNSKKAFAKENAYELIYKSACENDGNLIYLGIGPQTNLAIALLFYPDLKDKIKEVFFMGGSLVGGNITQASEFNAFVDPEALKIVVNSGIPLTMVGLDVTSKTAVPDYVLEEISKLNSPYAKLATQILDFCFRRNKELGYDEANIHDALAFCSIVLPSVIKTKEYYLDVETSGSDMTRGMTVADSRNVYPDRKPNVKCAVDVDLDAFWNWMINLFKSAEK